MAEILELDLGDRGGMHRFRSAAEVRKFVDEEFEIWRWMAEGPDRFGLWQHLSDRLVSLRDNLTNNIGQGERLTHQAHHFLQVFGEDATSVLHSEGTLGRRVLDIHEAEGRDAALAAYAFALKRIAVGNVNTLTEHRGVQLLVMPSLIRPEATQRRLAQERANLRQRVDRLIQSLEDEGASRRKLNDEETQRARMIAFAWAKRRFRQWGTRFSAGSEEARAIVEAFSARHIEIEDEFTALKSAFLETMRLKAPATYWSNKATKHKDAEFCAMIRLLLFFPAAALGLGWVFWRVGTEILRAPPGGNTAAVYVVTSAGLATVAGVTFWIGRLLTKLYLSEHHLRIDAEEREIMTTTYLALTKESAAAESDRAIILSALFRNTPDGIVKDDGSMDVSLATLLSKVGLPGR